MEKTHEQLWEDCLRFFKDNIPAEQYDAWFKDITSKSYKDGALELLVPSSYFVEQLENRYYKLIVVALRKFYGNKVQLYYSYNQVHDEPSTGIKVKSSNPSTVVSKSTPIPANPFKQQQLEDIDSQLNPRYNFENYCGSNSNKIALTIGEAIATNPKCKTFNPFFVFRPSGVGKTHLIQAIGIRIKEHNPESRVLYVTARLFESQYTAAVSRSKINEFINFYQSIDTLIIDDIQDLIGKQKTQNTFFHIFNHLHQNQKQLILSFDMLAGRLEIFPILALLYPGTWKRPFSLNKKS